MIPALVLAAVSATSTPQAHTGVSGASNPAAANSGAMRTFSGGHVKPIQGTAEPLLQKAAPAASTNPQGQQVLRTYTSAGQNPNPAPGTHGTPANWGWFGLFGVFGLVGLWRRYSGA